MTNSWAFFFLFLTFVLLVVLEALGPVQLLFFFPTNFSKSIYLLQVLRKLTKKVKKLRLVLSSFCFWFEVSSGRNLRGVLAATAGGGPRGLLG